MENINKKDNFSFIMDAELTKSDDGEWKVRGLASTESIDKQGELILQKGIDLSPVEEKRGILNWDHNKGPENTIGIIEGYNKSNDGLFIEGKLFKNHTKAKAVYEIMSSLGKSDKGRIGLSVEGAVLERDSKNPKIIKKCKINAVALTMNPVNSNTYADLIKSMSQAENFEFESTGENFNNSPTLFTADQVLEIVQKALTVGDSYNKASINLNGGDALTQENLESKKKKNENKLLKLQKSKELLKSEMLTILDKLQVLYPQVSRSELWEAIKDRLNTNYPIINN